MLTNEPQYATRSLLSRSRVDWAIEAARRVRAEPVGALGEAGLRGSAGAPTVNSSVLDQGLPKGGYYSRSTTALVLWTLRVNTRSKGGVGCVYVQGLCGLGKGSFGRIDR